MDTDLATRVEQLESALDCLSDGVVYLDQEGKIQWHNQVVPSLLGLTMVEEKDLNLEQLLSSPAPKVQTYLYNHKVLEFKLKKLSNHQYVLTIQDVTNSQNLQDIFDTISDYIHLKDSEGKWVKSNQANLKLLALEPLDYQGKLDLEIAQLSPVWREIITTESAYPITIPINSPDGGVRIIEWTKVPLVSSLSNPKSLVVIGRDITNYITTEIQYKDLVETANCIILRWDTQGNILYLNDYGQKLFGFKSSQILGQNVMGTIVPKTETSGRDLDVLMKEICQRPEKYQLNENENICQDGRRVWVVWANKPIFDNQGNLIEILSVGTDATEKRQTQMALEKSLSLQQATFESIADGILAVDKAGNIINYNQNLLRIWSISPQLLQIDYLAQQLKEPQEFINTITKIHAKPEAICYDRLELKDGRIIEQYSCPQKLGQEIIGRVWTFREITESLRTAEALKDSEARLQMILSSIFAAINLYRVYPDRHWEIEYVSPGSRWTWGYEAEDLIEHPTAIVERIVPEDLDAIYQQVFDYIFREETFKYEYRYHHPDGSLHWIAITLNSHKEPDCDCWIATVIAIDITERKKVEEALRISESQFRVLYESLSVAIVIGGNQEQGIVDFNQAAEKLFGCSRTDVVGKHVSEISPPYQPNGQDSFTLANQYIAEAAVKGIHQFEWVHRKADGTDFPCKVTLILVKVGDYELVQGIIEDLTERKQVETDLARRLQLTGCRGAISRHLAQSESLSSMLQNCAGAIASAFTTTTVEIWAVESDLHSLSLQALVGEQTMVSVGETLILDRQSIWQEEEMGETQIMKVGDLSYQDWALARGISSLYRYPLVLGTQLVGLLIVFPQQRLNWEEGQTLRAISDDLALGIKRQQTESALTIAKEMAETANRAKSIFLANMSHELRTPLNTILGYAQLLEKDESFNPQQKKALDTINRSGEHLLNLINDVLEMSKIETGKVSLHQSVVDLHQLLDTLEEMFWVKAKSKNLWLNFELRTQLPQYIKTDAGKLRQVLINLLGNAVKFTQRGGVNLKVFSNPSSTAGMIKLLFEIRDTGIGIPEQELEHLFQPFVQMSNSNQVSEGTGLGLAISRQFIQLLGGNIQVRSNPRQGSTFFFDIRAELADGNSLVADPPPRRVVHLAPDQPSCRILVVDDRVENQELLIQILTEVGLETQSASNGEEAIALWQSWQPHLIWMDMRMPVIDGYEATRRIRNLEAEHPHQAKTIIIALTASAFEEQQLEILQAGCDDFVSKPFATEIIFNKMAEYLDLRYQYADQISQQLPQITEQNLIDSLKQMPQPWLEQLEQSATRVNSKLILELLHNLPPEQKAIAEHLSNLVQQFRFDLIVELVKQL